MSAWRALLALGGLAALGALVLGALGAHALRVPAEAARAYQTAVDQQMLQALGLMVMGLTLARWPLSRMLRAAGGFLLAGMTLFSGGIYLRTFTGIASLGPLVPGGGLLMMIGWGLFALAVVRLREAR